MGFNINDEPMHREEGVQEERGEGKSKESNRERGINNDIDGVISNGYWVVGLWAMIY